jgi:predicted nuclease of restriction endonuclease-like RecB superfamily
VRLSLQDVKKRVYRRAGERYLALHWLRPGELRREIAGLIAYYEQLLGQPRRAFSPEEARACIGDHRLADCLMSVLGTWYSWNQPDWPLVIARFAAGESALLALQEAGIDSPARLRLALFDYVNSRYHGFLASDHRAAALAEFAARFFLAPGELETLLMLDSSEDACLLRLSPAPPQAEEVALLYNQAILEAALTASSEVSFVIDCLAMGDSRQVGVGAVIKRLCYLARRLGVYYDLAYERAPSSQADADEQALLLRLTLYGPQEMSGLPQQYGRRLAHLCRSLLDERRPSSAGRTRRSGGSRFRQAILTAEARVHLGARSYRFSLDAQLLALLAPPATAESQSVAASSPGGTDQALFDSSIESTFAAAFHALEDDRGVDGWRLEREPEPLLLPEGIFIPDFALTRGRQRIYLEILGFWTPAYRERKLLKLQQLRGREDILLLIPEEARAAFAPLSALFPVIWYSGQIAMADLLQLLRRRYDDFLARLARVDGEAVRRRVRAVGFIEEQACYALLHCYRRAELAQAAEQVCDAEVCFAPGVGLYQRAWFERLAASLVAWVKQHDEAPLSTALAELRARQPQLGHCDDATLEALIELIAGIHIRHSSIFEATIVYDIASKEAASNDSCEAAPAATAVLPAPRRPRQARVLRQVGERTDSQPAQQADLWT